MKQNSRHHPATHNGNALTVVMLSTTEGDLGLMPVAHATHQAQLVANDCGQTVYVRHPVTDVVLNTIKPTK